MQDHVMYAAGGASVAIGMFVLAPAPGTLLGVALAAATATYVSLPSALAAAGVIAVACLAQAASVGMLPGGVLGGAHIGALAYLLAAAATATGLAHTPTAATILAVACTVSLVVTAVNLQRQARVEKKYE